MWWQRMSTHIKSTWHSSWSTGSVSVSHCWDINVVFLFCIHLIPFYLHFPSWLLFSKFYSLFFIVLILDVVSLLPLQGPPLCRQILTRWPLDILVGVLPSLHTTGLTFWRTFWPLSITPCQPAFSPDSAMSVPLEVWKNLTLWQFLIIALVWRWNHECHPAHLWVDLTGPRQVTVLSTCQKDCRALQIKQTNITEVLGMISNTAWELTSSWVPRSTYLISQKL